MKSICVFVCLITWLLNGASLGVLLDNAIQNDTGNILSSVLSPPSHLTLTEPTRRTNKNEKVTRVLEAGNQTLTANYLIQKEINDSKIQTDESIYFSAPNLPEAKKSLRPRKTKDQPKQNLESLSKRLIGKSMMAENQSRLQRSSKRISKGHNKSTLLKPANLLRLSTPSLFSRPTFQLPQQTISRVENPVVGGLNLSTPKSSSMKLESDQSAQRENIVAHQLYDVQRIVQNNTNDQTHKQLNNFDVQYSKLSKQAGAQEENNRELVLVASLENSNNQALAPFENNQTAISLSDKQKSTKNDLGGAEKPRFVNDQDHKVQKSGSNSDRESDASRSRKEAEQMKKEYAAKTQLMLAEVEIKLEEAKRKAEAYRIGLEAQNKSDPTKTNPSVAQSSVKLLGISKSLKPVKGENGPDLKGTHRAIVLIMVDTKVDCSSHLYYYSIMSALLVLLLT